MGLKKVSGFLVVERLLAANLNIGAQACYRIERDPSREGSLIWIGGLEANRNLLVFTQYILNGMDFSQPINLPFP